MRITRASTVLLALLLIPGPGAAQQDFEGTVTYKMSGQGMAMDMVHYVRGDKVRQEMSGPMGAIAMIIDRGAGTMTTVMTAQKMYMTMDMKQMVEQAQQMRGERESSAELDITETGRSETIAGHRCEYYIIKMTEGTTEICAAKGLGFYMASQTSPPGGRGGRGGRGAAPSAEGGWDDARMAKLRARFEGGFFPLKMTVTPDGGAGMTMEVTKLERKSISEDMFVVPEGFTKIPGFPGN